MTWTAARARRMRTPVSGRHYTLSGDTILCIGGHYTLYRGTLYLIILYRFWGTLYLIIVSGDTVSGDTILNYSESILGDTILNYCLN